MTRKERQKANGIGAGRPAFTPPSGEKEVRFVPIKGRPSNVKSETITKRLGLDKKK
jgi:hypothetical protein